MASRPPAPRGRRRPGGLASLGGAADLARALLRGVAELLGVLATGLLGRVGGGGGGLLGDLLAVLERFLARLLDLLADLLGHRADLLVLEPARRDEQAGEEADGDAADREAERVLLGDAGGLLGLALHLARLRRALGDRAGDLVLDAAHLVLRPALHVGLVAQRVDGVTHLRAGLLYLCADPVRVFAHCTSSFTVSTVCSGTGGAAAWTRFLPCWARIPAIATSTTPTIRAASQLASTPSRSMIRKAVSAPAPSRPTAAAPVNMPAPLPACLPFSVSSALARSISCRTSVEVWSASCLTSSPIGRSRRSWSVSGPAAMSGPRVAARREPAAPRAARRHRATRVARRRRHRRVGTRTGGRAVGRAGAPSRQVGHRDAVARRGARGARQPRSIAGAVAVG